MDKHRYKYEDAALLAVAIIAICLMVFGVI